MKVLLSLPLVALLVAYFVRGAPGIAYNDDYRIAAVVGIATGVVVVLLLLMRIWMGPGMTQEVRAFPLHYGGPLLGVAAAVFVIGKAQGDPPVGMTRTQARFVAGFKDGCAKRGREAYCDCVAHELLKSEGIESTEDIQRFAYRVEAAIRTGNPRNLPASMRRAFVGCAGGGSIT